MKIFKNKEQLNSEIYDNKPLSFIPTMGGLHKGHIFLIKQAKRYRNKIIVSIYINPKQFDKNEDYKKYPRNLKRDIKILKKLNIDYLYIPNFNDLFKFNPKHKVYLHKFSKMLCGKFRKKHFNGVLNVVNRFLDILKPKFIFLGLKDFQQLTLINKHVKKYGIKTKIISCKTIRESNGVACSTRNYNLSKSQMNIAKKVYDHLIKFKRKAKYDIKKFNSSSFRKVLFKLGVDKIDYLNIINIENLQKAKNSKENFNIFIAYYIKNIRLIDNV